MTSIFDHAIAMLGEHLGRDGRKTKVQNDPKLQPYRLFSDGGLATGCQRIGVALPDDNNCRVIIELVMDSGAYVRVSVRSIVKPITPADVWTRTFPLYRFEHGSKAIDNAVRALMDSAPPVDVLDQERADEEPDGFTA